MLKSAFKVIMFLSLPLNVWAQQSEFNGNEIFATVNKYVSLGEHRTGTKTDIQTSEWIGSELKSAGYEVNFLEFPIRQFFPEKVYLATGKDTIQAFPLWWVNESINREVSGKLQQAQLAKSGDIALIHFPLKGAESGLKTREYIDSLARKGISGIVAITDNPSGEIEAYNTDWKQKPWPIPVVLIAPKDESQALNFIKQHNQILLSIQGQFRDVKGRNIYGTIGHGDKYIVVSTPISGWVTCGGERGSGIGIWLALAKWVARQNSNYTFVFTANSGHEHAFKGAHEFLERFAPPVEKTALWIHFGAGAATLEWKQTATGLVKQANVDPQRRFFYSSLEKEVFNNAFSNITAVKVQSDDSPGGELIYVAQKGYKNFVGVSYAHPFFHVKTDNEYTTSSEILEETANAFKNLIKATITK
ncbi:hypothetical protein [Parabacteroides sp. FAFU027]|uniref:hypothetical protein n=1 Tax=Parabacteroides sp. FAFU027 TaxID=2922715 RepID=UPI001FAEF061|nr:hypothetical protein [Parabacteroides sp. FAFU027]